MSDLYLIARIAGRTVAIDSAQVESVVDIGEMTPVPLVSDHVRGLAALRSRVVTVVDARSALGAEDGHEGSNRAVLTNIEGHFYALLVDALDDVESFELRPLARGVPLDAEWSAAACGLIERQGEPILAIDLSALIPDVAPVAVH